MAELKNEFSWSWSRHRAFETCRRQYWLQHYGFWGGWEAEAPSREIYIQKRLNSRPQWIGLVVHEAAEWVLGQVRRGHYPPPDRVVERFRRHAQRMIDDSSRGLYRIKPKRAPGFVDHYYDLGTTAEEWDAACAEIGRQIRGLFENPVFLRLTRVPGRIEEVEQLAQVLVGDVPVWVSLDVLVRDGEGGLVIIDWKTGAAHDPDTVSRQLGVYGVYVMDRYFGIRATQDTKRPVGQLKTMYANLRENTFAVYGIDEAGLRTTTETILESAAAMRAQLADAAENTANEADFPMVPEGSKACAWCPFRRTCGREG